MKLENISKIFGVLASISFVVMILLTIIAVKGDGFTPQAKSILISAFLGITIMFLLAAILTTLKRIAHGIEGSRKE
jgi:uncharacterized membrane protein